MTDKTNDLVQIDIDSITNIEQVKAVLSLLLHAQSGFNGEKARLQVGTKFLDVYPALKDIVIKEAE